MCVVALHTEACCVVLVTLLRPAVCVVVAVHTESCCVVLVTLLRPAVCVVAVHTESCCVVLVTLLRPAVCVVALHTEACCVVLVTLLTPAVCCCSIELNMDLPQAQSTTIGSASQASQQQVSFQYTRLFDYIKNLNQFADSQFRLPGKSNDPEHWAWSTTTLSTTRDRFFV